MLTRFIKRRHSIGGFWGALAGAVGSVAGGLLGGGSSTQTKPNKITPAELARLQQLEDMILAEQGYKRGANPEVQAQYDALKAQYDAISGVGEAGLQQGYINNDGAFIQRNGNDPIPTGKKLIYWNPVTKSPIAAENLATERDSLRNQMKAIEQGGQLTSGIQKIEGFQSEDDLIRKQYEAQSAPLMEQFKSLLNQSLTKDFALNGANPAEARAAAEKFTDETFTNAARARLQDFRSQVEGDLRSKAASLGREPNLDSATQSRIFEESMRGLRDLELERGARVAERADMLGYQRPLEQLERAAGGLGVYQGQSSFITDLANKARENRLNLINMRTGFADRQARERGVNVSQYTNPGLIGAAGGLMQGTAGLVQGYRGLQDLFKNEKPQEYISNTAGGYTYGAPSGGKFGFGLGDLRK